MSQKLYHINIHIIIKLLRKKCRSQEFLRRIRYATNRKYISHLKSTKFNKTCDGGEIISEEEIDSVATVQPVVQDTSEITVQDTLRSERPEKLKVKKLTKFKTYTVRKGDTLYDIARKNKTTVLKIKKANKLNSNKIKPGLKLKIPR